MDYEATKHGLELRLLDINAQPTDLPISLLREITNNFSDAQQIGRGGFAVVYEGQLKNGTIAVKKLYPNCDMDEKKFIQEVDNLMKVKHKNIVRFLGYCAVAEGKLSTFQGKKIVLEEVQRLLCFEFLPNGSLDKYIADASRMHEWKTRYQIIKGFCEGLCYLHESRILHLDLKPANILLSGNMVPKIADFGLSRCFDEKQTRALATQVFGTRGYMAPESFSNVITYKSDIYSLGVIILEILTGSEKTLEIMSGHATLVDVLRSWKSMFKASKGDARLEQVRVCTQIAMECIDFNPDKRPDAKTIIEKLDDMERIYSFTETDPGTCNTSLATHVRFLGSSEISKQLELHPLEIRVPFEANKYISSPITLANWTHLYAGIWITQISQKDGYSFPFYFRPRPREGLLSHFFQMIEPQTTWLVDVVMNELPERPPHSTYEFEVLMIVSESKEQLRELNSFFNNIMHMGSKFSGVEVLGTKEVLKVVICDQPIPSYFVEHHQLIPIDPQDYLDVHPMQTWILVASYNKRNVRILNYQTQEIVAELHVTGTSSPTNIRIWSSKFIARQQWFATGDQYGWVHIYSYSSKDKIKQIQCHPKCDPVDSLAVHPSQPYLLTASSSGGSIKLWDWSHDWMCTGTFHMFFSGVVHDLVWNPSDTNISFAYVDSNNRLKVYEIGYGGSTPRLDLELIHSASFIDNSHLYLSVTKSLKDNEYEYHIWDWHTKECVHRLGQKFRSIRSPPLLVCHPTLPIFVTTDREVIQLWHARTYRLLETFPFGGGHIDDIIFTGTKYSTRLVVRSSARNKTKECIVKCAVSVIEINLTRLGTGEGEPTDDDN